MTLQFGCGLGHVHGGDHPADAPARHGVGLGHAVEHEQLGAHFGHRGADVRGFGAVIVQVFVDFVGNDPHVVFDSPLRDGLDGFRLPHRARRVVRRVHDDGLRVFGARGLDVLDARLEVAVGAGEHGHGHAAGELHGFRIAGPVRGGDDDLVALVEQNLERFVDGLLAAVGHDDLAWVDFVAGVAQRLVRDGLAQFRQTCRGRVTIVFRILHRGGRGRDDRCGGWEVRFSRAEPDDVDSGGLHCLRLGIDGQGSARSHVIDTVG